jgi:hypothetical protein
LQGASTLYDPELPTELADYSLAGLPGDLPGFKREASARPYLIDIERGRLGVREEGAGYTWIWMATAKPTTTRARSAPSAKCGPPPATAVACS